MVGIHLGATHTSAPGIGSRILTVYGTDSEAFSTSDLPFGANTVFVTGVVYRDTDKDYTPGEGLGNITVTPDSGNWFAVTSGYQRLRRLRHPCRVAPAKSPSPSRATTPTGRPDHRRRELR